MAVKRFIKVGEVVTVFLLIAILVMPGYGQTKKTKPATRSKVPEIEMVFVKGGTFMMGCTPEQEPHCGDDEKPAHKVTLSDFYIGKYEVTQKLWAAVVGDIPMASYCTDTIGDHLPVSCISWRSQTCDPRL